LADDNDASLLFFFWIVPSFLPTGAGVQSMEAAVTTRVDLLFLQTMKEANLLFLHLDYAE